MLKIRIEGEKEDIYKYVDYLRNDKNINILNISNCFANHGISVYSRCFVEIQEPNVQIRTEDLQKFNSQIEGEQ